MLTLRTLLQIASSRTIPSFRSAPSRSQSGGDRLTDASRIGYHQSRTQAQEARRQWLQQQWQNRP
ncbi:hypothetical protein IQ265_08435 [Nodosilinea sp. LEGE 06152]|uniref:hypothetical protein n=1 Tax=Nodosilinea sp. LEGE 06152 TaxID=2777966 RepID=UPI00187FDDAF|nr:hypothetical protein [Nodosilinea sp. LEGE 06152]MBE9156857.1 hypothetical protein [Nodosilinea sp. LEGE 06152]